jgi:hypothetical protein
MGGKSSSYYSEYDRAENKAAVEKAIKQNARFDAELSGLVPGYKPDMSHHVLAFEAFKNRRWTLSNYLAFFAFKVFGFFACVVGFLK